MEDSPGIYLHCNELNSSNAILPVSSSIKDEWLVENLTQQIQ